MRPVFRAVWLAIFAALLALHNFHPISRNVAIGVVWVAVAGAWLFIAWRERKKVA